MAEETRKPNAEDAKILAHMYATFVTDRIYDAFVWFYSVFGYYDTTKAGKGPEAFDYEAFVQQNPRGSDGYKRWTAIASFFETLGVLVRHGVLHEAVVLDRFPVESYWRYLEPIIEQEREQGMLCDTAWIADNFQFLAERALEFRKAGLGHARFLPGSGGPSPK